MISEKIISPYKHINFASKYINFAQTQVGIVYISFLSIIEPTRFYALLLLMIENRHRETV